MAFKNVGKEIVEEVPYGMYVWQTPDGWVVQDDDANVMNVFCMKGDRKATDALRQAAAHFGFPEGKPLWWGGKRRITAEELEEQLMREKWGLEPDPLNYAGLVDAAKERKAND